MDPTDVYVGGVHPAERLRKLDLSGPVEPLPRTVANPKYSIIDFGHSKQYSIEGSPEDVPRAGGDRTVPEFQGDGINQLYNPFPADIYMLGNMLLQYFVVVSRVFAIIRFCPYSPHSQGDTDINLPGTRSFASHEPLFRDMIQSDPTKRPTIDAVVSRFEVVQRHVGPLKLRSRVVYRDEFIVVRPFHFMSHWTRILRHSVSNKPTLPKFYCKRS